MIRPSRVRLEFRVLSSDDASTTTIHTSFVTSTTSTNPKSIPLEALRLYPATLHCNPALQPHKP